MKLEGYAVEISCLRYRVSTSDHEALAGQKSLSHGGDSETQPQERAALEARSGEIMNPE